MNKKISYIIFSFIVVVLSASLIMSMVTKNKKNQQIEKINNSISENESLIQENEKSQKELQEKLQTAEQEKEQIKSEHEKIQQEKEKLEKENSTLRNQIAKLNAAKRAEIISVINQTPPQSGDKVCYLTFDDGPSDNTLKFLDILKDYNVKATFFVINNSKIGYVKRIHEEGHTVALHTATHNYAQLYSSKQAYYDDLIPFLIQLKML